MLPAFVKRSILRPARWLEREMRGPPKHDVSAQQNQILLKLRYRDILAAKSPLPSFRDVGFKCFSEFEEDGILLFLFSIIGERSRRVVEICAGNGKTCMATNLIINHGWEGFLFDGNEAQVKSGQQFFAEHPATRRLPPAFRQAWITVENINQILRPAEGEVDLLSLDIDGNDYWIWKAIEAIQPRVVLAETHDIIPSELAITIPYEPTFNAWTSPQPDFRSVSLKAMTDLSKGKGYRLIGSHRYGFNVFFLRNDIASDLFPEVEVAAIHDNPSTRQGRERRWPKVKDMSWETVS